MAAHVAPRSSVKLTMMINILALSVMVTVWEYVFNPVLCCDVEGVQFVRSHCRCWQYSSD